MRFLRQSTASQEILLGPFVAAADGSAQTGLTIANTDIKLLPGGATSESNKNSGGGTHIAGGRYSAVLDATDTATVGILEVSCNPASGIPWNKSYYVLEEAVYDALFAASAVGPLLANSDGSGLTAINLPNQTMDIVGNITGNLSGSVGSVTGAVGSVTGNVGGSVASIATGGISEASYATTAGSFAPLGIVDQGTAQSATGTTLVLRSAAAFADDELIGATIVITGGSAGVGQSRTITDYVSSTDTATVETWTTTPTGTITYKIFATAPSSGGSGPTASEIADAVWDEATSGHTTSGTFGEQVKTDIDAILVDTGTTLDGRIPAALVSGRMDVSVGAMAANVMTAAAAASDLTTELQSGLATAAELAKVPKSDGTATWNATALASIQSEANDALVAYDPPTKAELDAAAAGIADAVWTELVADHSGVSGSTAEALAAAGGAGDPWITALPGSYSAGQAGYIVGTNLNATVSSRASQSGMDDLPTNAELATALGTADDAVLAAIAALNNVSVANILAATVEGSTTLVQTLRLLNSALGGKAGGLDTTTVHYRDLADTKDRILATVDADGNRTAVTLDLS